MSFLKSIAAPIVTVGAICATLAVSATRAEAYEFCMPWMGGEICATSGLYQDQVSANIPGLGSERMTIKCINGGYEYRSRGSWTRAQVNEFVEGYCSGRGSNAHG